MVRTNRSTGSLGAEVPNARWWAVGGDACRAQMAALIGVLQPLTLLLARLGRIARSRTAGAASVVIPDIVG